MMKEQHSRGNSSVEAEKSKSEHSDQGTKTNRMQKMLSKVPGGAQILSLPPTVTWLAVKRYVEMSSLTVEECELLSDAKYRSYINQVEKALKSFEYTSEWADLISALGKLNKVLLNHIKYPVVPKKVTIGKRLAQCLHPALPSGVHLKALDTYDIIFKCIGTPRLAHDLFVYSAGLFPLMGHAAMNVKPALLAVYEKHFTQLGKQVKPGLNGLLLGLLPGLEEGSEYYDRTNRLMEEFCEAAGPAFFYTCLWECIMTCPNIRLPACTYLSTHYNKKKSMEDQLYLMGQNIDLMVEATCSAVQDSSVLVQRCILDFLLNAFPMHNAQLTRVDTGRVVNAALCVLLRRDMSLNRRLYAWLLGTDAAGNPVFSGLTDQGKKGKTDSGSVSGELDMTFFHSYSKDKLVSALNSYLTMSSESLSHSSFGGTEKHVALRPFRILISLLDKPEIGPAIIEDVLLGVFRCLYRECVIKAKTSESSVSGRRKVERSSSVNSQSGKYSRQDSQVSVELTKTANLLVNTLEPYFIWDFIARNFEAACVSGKRQPVGPKGSGADPESSQGRDAPSVLELCQLVDFLLDIVSLETYMETTTEHLPDLLRHITCSLTAHCVRITDQEVTASLRLCAKILQKVQPSMNILGSEAQEKETEVFLAGDQDIDINSTFATVTHETPGKDAKEEAGENDEERHGENRREEAEGSSQEEAEEEDSGAQSVGSRKSSTPTLASRVSENDESPGTGDNSVLREFQRYNSIEIERSPSRVSYRISGPLTLMQACVQSFQDFFHVFVSEKVLGDKELAKKCLDQVTLSSDSGKGSDRDSVLEGGSINSQEEVTPGTKLGVQCLVSSDRISSHLCEAFSSACKLLVDFSSFPMYCTDYHKLMDQTFKQDEELTLPSWLQGLITCTSFVDSFMVKTAAISTMLDLIILTQSVQSETESKDAEHGHKRSVTEGTVSVVILPLLLPKHLYFLNSSTLFYRMVAEGLWEYLGEESSGYHQTSVELFHQLHQVTPNSWVCEDVIGNALIQEDQQKRIDAYKKFTVLWHLTRDKRMETTPGRMIRTYDRSMFVVLDSLKEETSPTQTIAGTWVTHSLQRGDLGRILEPILLMLFHPDTARISIQHVNIHQPKKVKLNDVGNDIESTEAKIYAISNEGGNVIYHISSQGKTISKKSAEDLKSYALTVVNEKGSNSKFVTAPTRAQPDFPFERVNADMLNLRVNPFGTENVLERLVFDGLEIPGVTMCGDHPDLASIKRLNKETCQKEGIVFEDRDLEESEVTLSETPGEQEESVEDMVLEILEGLIDKATERKLSDTPVPLRSARETSVVSRDSVSCPEDELLNSIERQGVNIDSPSGSDVDLSKQNFGSLAESNSTDIHTLHMHILLYTQKYDFQRTLYALTTLKSLIRSCPRLLVVSMATCSISAVRTPHLLKVQTLLARHRKSVFGKNFFGEVPPETLSSCRTNMYLEILVSVLLYYVRSYYPNLMMSKLAPEELMGNREVHILSAEILALMMSELILITKDSGKSFASYMDSLLTKCKLQKALLHCVLASIYNARRKFSQEGKSVTSFTETIVDFNEENLDSSAVETFQIKLLHLLRVMVQLEDHIVKAKGEQDASSSAGVTEWEQSKVSFQPSLSHVRYNPALPMVHQAMFLSGILSALKQQHVAHMHRHWISMVTSSLPFMGKALSHIVMAVVAQLCRNLDMLAQVYGPTSVNNKASSSGLQRVPPDHMLTMLEGLTTLCHYCLLDSSPQVSLGAPLPSGASSSSEANNYASQIIFNLLHVFNPVSGKDSSPQRDLTTAVSPVMEARRDLLSILPRIIACLATIWKAITLSNQEAMDTQSEQANWTMGSPKIIQRYILDFLSPLSQSHGVSLLGAVAVAWNDRRKKSSSHAKKVIPVPCDDQLLLVDLVSEIKVLPTDKLVQMVKQVMKQPPPSELTKNKKSMPLEVNLLQFFFAYIQQTSGLQLIDSWPSLLTLIKDGLQLNISPPGQFLLLEILNEAVQRMPGMDDRKSQKELQDIVQKVLDSVSTIAGSCLAQTTWLRRNLAVRPGPQTDIHDVEDGDVNEESDMEMSPPLERKVIAPQSSNSEISKYSVQALTQLAERTASLLDVVYGSEEKEKVVPFLTSIMYNVFPYLRNHSPHNLPSFRACSQFLSGISGYQYTRKSWRKEALELLLDPSFFQMDQKCIGYWETIIDNLMTHDKTTFKDLMSRVTVVQAGSLNLFSSKDQEFEQRTLLLKRLAFTLFCSEPDQYQRNMPDIQERLSESLRLPQVPSVMSQVFLCFRVLILRMSPQHLTSLWPTIITEMVQVFLQIEQELSTETDEFKAQLQRIAALDSTWAHLGNGLNAHNNPAWLQLYLSACKLLDLALALPADVIPQFQLYRWAFIGEDCSEEDGSKKAKAWTKPTFVPHIVRVSRLLNTKVPRDCGVLQKLPGSPLLSMSYLRSLVELQPFFNTLATLQEQETTHKKKTTHLDLSGALSKSRSVPEFSQLSRAPEVLYPTQYRSVHQLIEASVEKDFLEFLPAS